MTTSKARTTALASLVVVLERILIYSFFVGLWFFVQFPILNALLFREKYGLFVFPLSLFLVCCARYHRGGLTEVQRELECVGSDLSFPLWFLCNDTILTTEIKYSTTTDYTRELLRRLATLSKYLVMYGPLSFGGVLMFLAPLLAVAQPMLYESWFPPFRYALLVATTLFFCGIVTNACMHRFFSHASYKTSRTGTFLLGLLGCLGGQFGPLWWASSHRRHHKYCETELDVHCPALQGFWYAHCGWIMDRDNFAIRTEYVPKVGRDWPELYVLDVFCTNLQFAAFLGVAVLLGRMNGWVPNEADPPGFILKQVVWGVEEGYVLEPSDVLAQFVDTGLILGYALFLHFEFFINSWCHAWTLDSDKPQNKNGTCTGLDIYWVGILNAGEGFHANHHQFPAEAQHGPAWYLDWSYTFIVAMEKLGLVWDVVRPAKCKRV